MISIDDIIDTCNSGAQAPNTPVYQVAGILDSSLAQIIELGHANIPYVSLSSAKFKGYICQTVSYLLSAHDISQSILNTIGLIIHDNTRIVATITMQYHVNARLDDGKLTGYYVYEYANNNDAVTIGNTLESYPGKNKALSMLIDLLSDPHLNDLFAD